MRIHVRPYGQRALLAELPGLAEVHALAAALDALADPRVEDVVPAARTVLVRARAAADLPDVTRLVRGLDPARAPAPAHAAQTVRIPVTYDGPDLDRVAAATGLSRAEVVARHTTPVYTVEFLGFAPGFAYLAGLDPVLHLPRLETPRAAVPAGSVAVAGERTAVYPRESPGGWLLLGRTGTAMFDLAADPPALLRAGMHVVFEEAG